MRHPSVLLVSLLTVSLAACDSCSKEEEQAPDEAKEEAKGPEPDPGPAEPPPTEQRLSFSATGGGLDGKQFDLLVSDSMGFWMFDPNSKKTMVSARGLAGDLDTYLYVAVPQVGVGSYEFRPSDKGADTQVQLRFRQTNDNKGFALLAVQGKLEFEKLLGDYLIGSFSGKFVRSERLGADLADIPEAKRQYVNVSGGRFQVSWKDRLGGKAARWGVASKPAAPTPATP
jgi:hypothetical protein